MAPLAIGRWVVGVGVAWRRRRQAPGPAPEGEGDAPEPGPVRRGSGVALTVLALLLVWGALVAPNQTTRLTVGAFARVPLELLVVVAIAVVLPATPRRVLAAAAGALLGVIVIVKVLDMGFFTAFDRPFDPVGDLSQLGEGIETLGDAIGRSQANLLVAGAAVLLVGVLALPALALLRLTRVAAGHRDRVLQAVAALGVIWVVLRIAGAPAASTSAVAVAVDEVQAVRSGLQDHDVLAREIARDRFSAPLDPRLAHLRGKDVLLLFVESYGRVAVQDSALSPRINGLLERGTADLRAAGFSSRSAFLKSPTFGGFSWLAHATLQAGVRVDGQRRYDQLVKTDRLTLTRAFRRAGWRTVSADPVNRRDWPEGSSFYRFHTIYDRRNMGYRGPEFGLPPMPDQYVLEALRRLELAKRPRRPVFAEVDLISSHFPWTRIPELVPWDAVGDGSIFKRVPGRTFERSELFSDRDRVRAAYGLSIEYVLRTILSFVQRYGRDDLVIVMLGDHQPATTITGQNASHDVPISVIARDREVMDRIAGWDWDDGLRPSPHASVWPMHAFRDRFLTAFGASPRGPRATSASRARSGGDRGSPRSGRAGPPARRPAAPRRR